MILIHPPIFWYMAMSILIMAISWKLQILGDNPISYYVWGIVLVILAFLPAWKGVNRDEKIRQEIR